MNHNESNFNEPYAGFEKDGQLYFWRVSRLWELSKDLKTFEYEIKNFNGFDQDVWFGTQLKPTLKNILDHFNKIERADLNFPIILNQDGIVLDGIHRICKAHVAGLKTIQAVQFEEDPAPDRIEKLIQNSE